MSQAILRDRSLREQFADREMRAKILAMTASQAKQLGIGKSTLHNLRKRAADKKRFKIYDNVLNKLSTRN